MRILFNRCFVVFLGVAAMSSCSRPVAYFQPTARQKFATQPQTSIPVSQGVAIESSSELIAPAEATPAPVESVIQAKQAVSQLETYVRNDAKLGSNRKLVTRLVRLNEALVAAPQQSLAPAQVTTKKISFMERTMLKKLDKKIKHQLAPDQPKAMNSNIRLGIIIGVIGLVLLLIGGGVLTALGIIGLVVGIVLIVLGYLNS